ncbi:unnamed protein product [Urochloa humidicola]
MKLFMCFGGAAAVADDEAAAEAAAVAAGHRDQRGRSLSFRARFLSGMKGNKKKAESKKRGKGADDVYALFSASSTASLDSGYSSSSSSSSSRSSTASSSSSVSGEIFPPPVIRRQAKKASSSPAAGAAAVLLCLLMVVFCGRIGATVLMSTALYLFPRRWPARTTRGDGGVGSPECDAEKEITARRNVVRNQGFLLMMNRKK